jgi:hypothetical protein
MLVFLFRLWLRPVFRPRSRVLFTGWWSWPGFLRPRCRTRFSRMLDWRWSLLLGSFHRRRLLTWRALRRDSLLMRGALHRHGPLLLHRTARLLRRLPFRFGSRVLLRRLPFRRRLRVRLRYGPLLGRLLARIGNRGPGLWHRLLSAGSGFSPRGRVLGRRHLLTSTRLRYRLAGARASASGLAAHGHWRRRTNVVVGWQRSCHGYVLRASVILSGKVTAVALRRLHLLHLCAHGGSVLLMASLDLLRPRSHRDASGTVVAHATSAR